MPHNLRKCSALRIRAVVNKFIQAHMDFRYSGDWTAFPNPRMSRTQPHPFFFTHPVLIPWAVDCWQAPLLSVLDYFALGSDQGDYTWVAYEIKGSQSHDVQARGYRSAKWGGQAVGPFCYQVQPSLGGPPHSLPGPSDSGGPRCSGFHHQVNKPVRAQIFWKNSFPGFKISRVDLPLHLQLWGQYSQSATGQTQSDRYRAYLCLLPLRVYYKLWWLTRTRTHLGWTA